MANPTISLGYTDSVTTKKTVSIPDLAYSADFTPLKEDATDVILTNVTSPVDQPETIRYGYQNIADIYRGSGIDPSFMATSKRGVSLVGQVNDIIRVTPSDESGCCVMQQLMMPIEAHWVLKFPVSQYVTPDMALAILERAFATAYATGSTTSAKLGAMMRGSLM